MDSQPPAAPSGVLHALWPLMPPSPVPLLPPTHRGLSYRDGHGRGLPPRVDVYLPETPAPHPSVIIVHGGAFVIGSRTMKPVRYQATRLVEAGFAVAAIDYRLVFRGGRLTEAGDDVRAAQRWWAAQRTRWSLDDHRTAMLGVSAGAALLWLAAASTPNPRD